MAKLKTDPATVEDLRRALIITAHKLRRKNGSLNARDRDNNIFLMEAAATEIQRRQHYRKRFLFYKFTAALQFAAIVARLLYLQVG